MWDRVPEWQQDIARGATEPLAYPDVPVELGQVVATPGAIAVLEAAGVSLMELLGRHVRKDWGDLDEEDKAANNLALHEGTRLLSAYKLPGSDQAVWVITEWDRSVTTLLLPEDY